MNTILAFITLMICISNAFGNQIHYPTADASIRRDRSDQNFGWQSHMIVTKRAVSKSRIGLMKFNTTYIGSVDDVSAKLVLFISGTDSTNSTGYRTVTVSRAEENFIEEEVTWNSYIKEKTVYEIDTKRRVSFDVHNSHVGQAGQIEISSLMENGEETLVVAIHIEDGGHVKLASKDHPSASRVPRLIVSRQRTEL